MEERRLAAAEDIRKRGTYGLAAKYGVSRMTVLRWSRAVRSGGSLARRPKTGRPPKAPQDQLIAFLRELHASRQPLSGKEMIQAILDRFGVLYNKDHLTRFVREAGIRPPRWKVRKVSGAQIQTAGRVEDRAIGPGSTQTPPVRLLGPGEIPAPAKAERT